jgi:hypothetical protein
MSKLNGALCPATQIKIDKNDVCSADYSVSNYSVVKQFVPESLQKGGADRRVDQFDVTYLEDAIAKCETVLKGATPQRN